mgnify:FL=1|jgi:hypothetical protein
MKEGDFQKNLSPYFLLQQSFKKQKVEGFRKREQPSLPKGLTFLGKKVYLSSENSLSGDYNQLDIFCFT